MGVSLVCLKQMTACTLLRRYAGRTEFRFKINERRTFALTILRTEIGNKRTVPARLFACNQRTQLRLRHNLNNVATRNSDRQEHCYKSTQLYGVICEHRNCEPS